MREKLLALVALQNVDLEIAALTKIAEAYPREIADLEKQLAAAKSGVDSERAKLEESERHRTQLEQTITDERDKVKKWEARLAEQRTTREYSALAREIDIAKKGQTTMGEEAVEIAKQSAIQRELVKTRNVEFAAKSAELTERIVALTAKLVEAEAAVKSLEGKRNKAASTVQVADATLLRRYDAVRKKRLPAMAAVNHPGTCQGCRMNIPAQVFNQLVASRGFDVCPYCSRIIHAAETLETSLAK